LEKGRKKVDAISSDERKKEETASPLHRRKRHPHLPLIIRGDCVGRRGEEGVIRYLPSLGEEKKERLGGVAEEGRTVMRNHFSINLENDVHHLCHKCKPPGSCPLPKGKGKKKKKKKKHLLLFPGGGKLVPEFLPSAKNSSPSSGRKSAEPGTCREEKNPWASLKEMLGSEETSCVVGGGAAG